MPVASVSGGGRLIDSESVRYFAEAGFDVVGIDNDLRARFFGADSSTRSVTEGLAAICPTFRYHRDRHLGR
jgi:CDP-paratose 2-epimerase